MCMDSVLGGVALGLCTLLVLSVFSGKASDVSGVTTVVAAESSSDDETSSDDDPSPVLTGSSPAPSLLRRRRNVSVDGTNSRASRRSDDVAAEQARSVEALLGDADNAFPALQKVLFGTNDPADVRATLARTRRRAEKEVCSAFDPSPGNGVHSGCAATTCSFVARGCQVARGHSLPRSARDNVKLCFRSLDFLVLLFFLGLLLYFMQRDYGLNVYRVLFDLFPRELTVLQRIFYGLEEE